MITFTLNDFYYCDWRDDQKIMEIKELLEVLNALTEEQKKAIQRFGESRYSEGHRDGYSEAESDCE